MSHARRPRLAIAVTGVLVGVLAAPAAATASCASPKGDLFTQVESMPVVFYGKAQPGALVGDKLASPATFDVVFRLDGGTATTEQVTTDRTATSMVGEGLAIAPKERWLITGRRGADGVVQTSACDPATRLANWGHRATWRIYPGYRHSPSTLSDSRGNPLAHSTLPKIPKDVRFMAVWTSTAARLIHRGKVTKLKHRSGTSAWDIRKGVRGDRVVIATPEGFWAAEVR